MRVWIHPLGGLGLVVWMAAAMTASPTAAAPGIPANLRAAPVSQNTIRLTWQDTSDNETGFRVQQAVGVNFVSLGEVPANSVAVNISGLAPGQKAEFRVLSFAGAVVSAPSNTATAITDASIAAASFCAPGADGVCLGGRFRLSGSWRTSTASGPAVPQALTSDSATLYFFAPSNLELLVKVLNACGLNNTYWVFYGATTDVEFTLTVTDTKTGKIRRYFNPLGRPAPPIQDTSAFATCP